MRSGDVEIDYTVLVRWADRITTCLLEQGVGAGDHIGVMSLPCTGMIAAVLGIMRAGAAYVPLDPAQSDSRIAAVLADAGVTCLVADAYSAGRMAGLAVPVVDIGDAPNGPLTFVPASRPMDGEDAAYLIYTSGSTGDPKGVLVEHAQLAASTAARRAVYPGAPVFLLMSPLAFDSSAAGIWGTLTAGGYLVVATADELRDPEAVVALIAQQAVTHVLCVPSLYAVLLAAAERAGADVFQSLRTVVVAGEPLPEQLVRRHFAFYTGHVALVNEYGPTEATVWASYQWFGCAGPVSIGGPIPGALLYVLDEKLNPVKRGVSGELFIGGAGVARGYHGDPAATAQSFIHDPFTAKASARMYRTGDFVRWNEAGTLDFLGRRDEQVKIRGHRVELGAVEAVLLAAPGVREAVVLPTADRDGLIAFVTGGELASGELREHAAQHLSPAMAPTTVVVLAELPLNINGKLDRPALRLLAEAVPDPVAAAQPSGDDRDPVAQVTAAWSAVLGIQDVPTDVNFFDLGGHSLAMFRLQDALELHTGTRPSMVALFRHTTVATQATLVGEGVQTSDEELLAKRQAEARRARALRARQGAAQRGVR